MSAVPVVLPKIKVPNLPLTKPSSLSSKDKSPAAELPKPIVLLMVLGCMVKVPPDEPVKSAAMAKLSVVMVKLAELMTLNTLVAAVLMLVAVIAVAPVL